MDEELQQLFLILNDVDKVVTYRTDMNFKEMMKNSYKEEMENLVNVEMEVGEREIILPEPKALLPVDTQPVYNIRTKVDRMRKDYENIRNVLKSI